MTVGTDPSGARIVYDEERRGWLVEVGPEPGRALLGEGRLVDTEAEAEELLQLRGFRRREAVDQDWPWRRIDTSEEAGHRPCVEDWVRLESSNVLPFEGDGS